MAENTLKVPYVAPVRITPVECGMVQVTDGTLNILLPASVERHQFKFRLPSGKWLVRAFATHEEAFAFIKENYYAADAFSSVSEWFGPGEVKRKRRRGPGYKWADNRIYRSIFVFDFDFKAKKSSQILAAFVTPHWNFLVDGFIFRHAGWECPVKATRLILVETGRGFHVPWLSFWEDYCEKYLEHFFGDKTVPIYKKEKGADGVRRRVRGPDGKPIVIDRVPFLWFPGNKEWAIEKSKKDFVTFLRDQGYFYIKDIFGQKRKRCLFDGPVAKDTRRVTRIPGTYHTKAKTVCRWYSSPEYYVDFISHSSAESAAQIKPDTSNGIAAIPGPAMTNSLQRQPEAQAPGRGPVVSLPAQAYLTARERPAPKIFPNGVP